MNDTNHLDPEQLFLLALPPAGEPEALPAHLSECPECARQFAEWAKTCRALAAEDAEPPADFERSVMSEVRRRRAPRSHRARRRAAAGLAAAAALLLAFGIGLRVGTTRGLPPAASQAGMSAADRGDDALLRDVSRLVAEDDDAAWKDLAPLPSSGGQS
jgi:anti-sigma factor RsiW